MPVVRQTHARIKCVNQVTLTYRQYKWLKIPQPSLAAHHIEHQTLSLFLCMLKSSQSRYSEDSWHLVVSVLF